MCVSPGEDSVPAGREERSGEPKERPGQKNKNVRIRVKAGKVRTDCNTTSLIITTRLKDRVCMFYCKHFPSLLVSV